MNLGGVLQALVDMSDCSKPPCNSLGSALPYMSYPAFPDSLLGKVCDLNPVKQYLHTKSLYIFFSKFLVCPIWANFLYSFVKVFFFFLRFYLCIHERQRQREREREREKQVPCREPGMGLDPGFPGSCTCLLYTSDAADD